MRPLGGPWDECEVRGEAKAAWTISRAWRRYLPSLLSVVILGFVLYLADRQRCDLLLRQEREQVLSDVAILRARLEGALNGPLYAARGLVAAIASEPEMDQARFDWLASRMMEPHGDVRNVAAARDLVVNMVYPLEGNEAVLGLDYLKSPAQRATVLTMRETGGVVLAGPLDLVQGGQGLIGRFPIFAERNGLHTFWGLLAVVIDPARLYARAGMFQPDLGLSIALVGRDGTGAAGERFLGDAALLQQSPVTSDILFPNGSWKLYAAPQGGWGSTFDVRPFRLALIALFLSGATLLVALNHNWVQRHRTIGALRWRERELEEAHQRLKEQALHDYMTGLPNRRYLDLHLTRPEAAEVAGILQLDLDHFKEVNDLAGHAVGDFLLQQVADRLREAVGAQGFLARSGGDEFVVVCAAEPAQGEAVLAPHDLLERLAKRVISTMRAPFRVAHREFRIGVSVGITEKRPGLPCAPGECLVQADRALYAAKALGRNRYSFSEPDRRADARERASATEFLEALAQGTFVPFYQPQFGRDGRTVVGAEALARWYHPRLGLLTPSEFVPLARVLKVENDLDQCILERVLRDLTQWEQSGLWLPKIAVNVSFQRINDANLIAEVDAVLAGAASARGRLTFELLESIFMDAPNAQVAQNIAALKERGIRLEIDDFGTGHASVTSLLRLRPKGFKIDRSLVQAAAETEENRQLLGTIASMGAALRIEVTAEGIETEQQLMLARAVGCNAFQGYRLARPMPLTEFEAFLHAARAEGRLARGGRSGASAAAALG